VSVVSRADIADRRRFKPFRLHCNVTRSTTRRVSGQGHLGDEGDEDLTLHYAVAAARGVVLRGPDMSGLLVSPPREDVAFALVSELDWVLEKDNPTNFLLNASRALAFATDALLLSKPEGWLWGRRHGLDPRLLDTALVSFLTRTEAVLSPGSRARRPRSCGNGAGRAALVRQRPTKGGGHVASVAGSVRACFRLRDTAATEPSGTPQEVPGVATRTAITESGGYLLNDSSPRGLARLTVRCRWGCSASG